MNAERLLQHYEQIADAPDAIARLRRFILDLAVRGKLVPQDANDEPASDLLKRIAKDKARLVKAGEIRRPPTLEPITDAELLYALPRTWAWVRVGDIFDYDAGTKRDPKELDQSRWLLELEDIEKDTSRIVERLRVSDRDSQSTKSEFEPGDILYGKLRPYLNKVVVADEPGYSTTEIVAIRPFMRLCPDYCALAFRRPDFVAYVERLGRGTKMPRLRTPDAIVAPFPLPPLAEQHRIVAKVDELMGLCDRLEAARAGREAVRDRLAAGSLARLNAPDAETFQDDARFALDALPALTTRPDQIKRLRQTILNLAVRGKLVPQDPNDEPASELLKRRRKAGGNAKLRRTVPEMVAVPSELLSEHLPTGWCLDSVASLLRVGAIVDLKDGNHGANHPKVSDFVEEGLPFITAAQVSEAGQIDYEGAHKLAGSPLDRLRVGFAKSGDVIYTHKGSVGRVALCDRDCVLSPQTTYYRLDRSIISEAFLRVMLLSDQFKDQVDAVKKQTTRDFVSIQKQYEFFLYLPPLAEQHRIVAKVDALMALCDRLEASLTATAATRRRLLDALLAEALAPVDARELEAAE